ncbi:MAG: glycine--tRNA ligase subunit beta [Gammaproteobacteria bacterium]|nr:glycine--tRNA ligase subunit beta [Gammaproteobacteria bacterium]
MSEYLDFLVELGTEELPPKALKKLAQAFESGIVAGLQKANLKFGASRFYASPRRLAVMVSDLQSKQADQEVERKGPAVQAAFKDDGCPTPAAEGFARSCGVAVEDLEKLETDKGAWLVYRMRQAGQNTTSLLPEIVSQSLDKLPIPKRMRWGASNHLFVRPVHWLIMLLGDDVVPAEILGLQSDRQSYGHRYHHPSAITIANAKAYAPLLESEAYVIVDFEQRRAAIRAQVEEAALSVKGKAVIDESLLDEVTGLVEWPRAIIGNFDEAFLTIPSEALVSAMKGHQKYFHVIDASGKLLPHFITIANIDSRVPESVRAGNERVIRPRLSDAQFFWQQDQKISLHARSQQLASIVFQNKLGSVLDKVRRVEKLAAFIGEKISANVSHCSRAAELAKADLLTEMVGEFPELQGIMGEYYAQLDGEDASVCAAIREHYQPRFAGDEPAPSDIGQAVAIAEKIDTLIGIFGIGQIPTGDKDPFALRRAALGVLRTIIEKQLNVDLRELLHYSQSLFTQVKIEKQTDAKVFDFMMERLRAYYQDQSISPQVFDAVLAVKPKSPLDFHQRLQAVNEFAKLEEAESLAAANKRISNILKKLDSPVGETLIANLMSESAEQALFRAMNDKQAEFDTCMAQSDYQAALSLLASLRQPVDQFFDQVLVMDDDPKVRHNRLTLLAKLSFNFNQVADIAALST